LQCFHLAFVLFQQAQTCPNHIAGRAIAPALHLGIDKASEVRSEGYGCVSAHERSPVEERQLYQFLVLSASGIASRVFAA
jgi:hypothetical protein